MKTGIKLNWSLSSIAKIISTFLSVVCLFFYIWYFFTVLFKNVEINGARTEPVGGFKRAIHSIIIHPYGIRDRFQRASKVRIKFRFQIKNSKSTQLSQIRLVRQTELRSGFPGNINLAPIRLDLNPPSKNKRLLTPTMQLLELRGADPLTNWEMSFVLTATLEPAVTHGKDGQDLSAVV